MPQHKINRYFIRGDFIFAHEGNDFFYTSLMTNARLALSV